MGLEHSNCVTKHAVNTIFCNMYRSPITLDHCPSSISPSGTAAEPLVNNITPEMHDHGQSGLEPTRNQARPGLGKMPHDVGQGDKRTRLSKSR